MILKSYLLWEMKEVKSKHKQIKCRPNPERSGTEEPIFLGLILQVVEGMRYSFAILPVS